MWNNYSIDNPQYPDRPESLPVEVKTPTIRYTAIDDLTSQIDGINNYNSVYISTNTANTPFTNRSTDNITDLLTGDKMRLLKASTHLIQQQITSRTTIKDDNIYRLDYKILECENYLVGMEFIPPFSNPMVEAKRANLCHAINRMESEKNQELVRCWSDQVRLYSELLTILGETQSAERRSKILNGDIS